MKYYSEEEVEKTLRQLGYMTATLGILSNMQPTLLPTLESFSSDREFIRMGLWSYTYTKHIDYNPASVCNSYAT